MKKVIIWILNILVMGSAAAVIAYEVFFAEEMDVKIVVKAATVLLTYILALFGVIRKRSVFDYKIYEDKYKDIIRNAFESDKRSYHRLMKAISLYNDDKYTDAIKVLDMLKPMCINYQDYSAVLMFKALCHTDAKQSHNAVATYEELLKMDHSNSMAWSNLGLEYTHINRTDLAENAYKKAIAYDKNNAFAYNNMAIFHVNNGEPEEGLECAMEALRINNKMYQALSAAAMCHAHLGNKEEAYKYCKMYGTNGGNGKNAKKLKENIDRIFEVES